MYNPVHPGETLQELYIVPLGLNTQKMATKLGVSFSEISEIIDGKRRVTPKLAAKLVEEFGGTVQSWINQQDQYDKWHARY